MAISSGSIIASHVNDGGFWIISKYFNMSVKDTLKTWTVLETVLSVVGFGMAALLYQFGVIGQNVCMDCACFPVLAGEFRGS
ncbi:gluconate permease [Arthrobacter sp. Hiyo8]|nr:gluconate permease [Arthrobacter sp. Hiyo8]